MPLGPAGACLPLPDPASLAAGTVPFWPCEGALGLDTVDPVPTEALVVATTGFGPTIAVPLNTPGLEVAAIVGVPWFTAAKRARFLLAVR